MRARAVAVRFEACAGRERLQWQPTTPDRIFREDDCMRIAQIAPLTEAIPPKLYGGTERVISWLADELVALGDDVVLFASGDSQTSAQLEASGRRPCVWMARSVIRMHCTCRCSSKLVNGLTILMCCTFT